MSYGLGDELADAQKELSKVHGCTNCYESNKGFHLVKNGTKKCDECGGTVLFLQELLDRIAEQDSELRGLYETL